MTEQQARALELVNMLLPFLMSGQVDQVECYAALAFLMDLATKSGPATVNEAKKLAAELLVLYEHARGQPS